MKDVNGNRRRWSLRRVRRSAPANLAVAALPLGATRNNRPGSSPGNCSGMEEATGAPSSLRIGIRSACGLPVATGAMS
jgi:hypothetical protein